MWCREISTLSFLGTQQNELSSLWLTGCRYDQRGHTTLKLWSISRICPSWTSQLNNSCPSNIWAFCMLFDSDCYFQNFSAFLFDKPVLLGIFLLFRLIKFQLHSYNWGWEASKILWTWVSKKTDFEIQI